MSAQCQTCGGPLAHDEFPCVACIPPNILAVMLDAIRRERDTLRAQLADHESEIASLTDSINNARRNAGIHADVDSLVVERLKSAIWELSYKVVEREAQLAAAQRVPEDANLDNIEANLRSCCDHERDAASGSIGCNWCATADAITALRRRVAELEAEPRHTINLLSDACECGHRRSYHRGWHNASSRLGCIGDDCACEQFNEIEEPQDA